MRHSTSWRLLTAIAMVLVAPIASRAEPASSTADRSAAVRLTVLGTAAGPGARVARAGIATLLEVDGHKYLIDAGSGVSRQLVRVGVHERDVRTIFLTHLHDDHTAGLFELLSFAATTRGAGVEVIGPVNTDTLVTRLISAMRIDADIRAAEQPGPDSISLIRAKVVAPGTIFSDGAVTVTAVRNSHFNFATSSVAGGAESLSYRFSTPLRTVVFCGDTGPSAALEQLAQRADVLVCEVTTPSDVKMVPPQVAEHMVRDHLSPTQLGELAARANVKTLVLSHVVNVNKADVDAIRKVFHGKIVVAADLDQLEL